MTTKGAREITRSIERDRRAVYAGAIVTTAVTPLLFALPDLLLPVVVEFRQFYFDRTGTWLRENPLRLFRLLGGVIGGIVAGWLSSEYGSGTLVGGKAALYGLVVAYLVTIAYYLVHWWLKFGVVAIMEATISPAIQGVLLFPAYLLGGIAAGGLTSYYRTPP